MVFSSIAQNSYLSQGEIGAFFNFEHRFFDIYLKIAQNGSFLSILSRFWLIFSLDKRHSRRGSRVQKGSKQSKNGGCKAKRYILGQNHLPFNLLSISKMHFSRSKSSVTKSENSASIADKCSESAVWLCEIKISKS